MAEVRVRSTDEDHPKFGQWGKVMGRLMQKGVAIIIVQYDDGDVDALPGSGVDTNYDYYGDGS